jgi:hypothetical protein
MTAEQAALELDARLRPFSWFVSVGIGGAPEGQTLFVYVKSARHKELSELRHGWKGFKVAIRAVGSIRATARPRCEQFPNQMGIDTSA